MYGVLVWYVYGVCMVCVYGVCVNINIDIDTLRIDHGKSNLRYLCIQFLQRYVFKRQAHENSPVNLALTPIKVNKHIYRYTITYTYTDTNTHRVSPLLLTFFKNI